ncbi:bifunctional phosphopantothenoylcysteine decarboxylase/phosphopantothenate--cysteine ligase CoaBC [Balneolaceae bacterium ANBcel3]|nr:bifunctional phosphopantothenoylcysteine decarboxylase/phosphopantothenate--cysteine ligase CoaBC [Balneolaceae bacterium ANBcel3]
MLRGKHIVIGVTGGIAAYKAVYLLRALQQAGALVRVSMTEAATRFVGRETFAALTRYDVPISVFPNSTSDANQNWTQHIQWAEWADLIVIAPCTANTLSKVVNGLSDSMLTSIVLASRCPLLLCPTMDGEMYNARPTQENLNKAKTFGYHILEPDSGYLASGLSGPGRLPAEDTIIKKIESLLSGTEREIKTTPPEPLHKPLLKGKNVVVTGGPTREFLDAVRFLSNPSSGKMGKALASAASNLGANTVFLHAQSVPVDDLSANIRTESFLSADDLFRSVQSYADADIIIMAAAVSDFKPAVIVSEKIKKDKADRSIALEQTPDILSWLGKNKKEGQVLVGFAMETENLAENARKKRIKKNADWIVANNLSDQGAGFEVDTNKILIIGNQKEVIREGLKTDLAYRILELIAAESF